MSRDDSQPPFPSGFGAEFDQAAWDHARAVGRAHAREFNRRADRFMGTVCGFLLVPTMLAATILVAASDDWEWAFLLGALTIATAVGSIGLVRGWAIQ